MVSLNASAKPIQKTQNRFLYPHLRKIPMAIFKQMKVKLNRKEAVQKNVKEGHFAVIAMHGGESRKFTVSLSLLGNREFLRLLERSQEEYGFEQRGILTLHCSPCELEDILTRKAKDPQGSFGVAKVLARNSR